MEFENLMPYMKDIIDYGIIGLLLLMSVVTFWIFIERMLFYASLKMDEYSNRDKLEIDLTNNIGIISSIASNAPYVGLLGTVGGIMVTFYTLGESSTIDAKSIMMGLALALKATALGLLVAIPAIVFYTITLRKVEKLLTKFDILTDEKNNEKV